jgi:hypothetical protein
VFEILSQRIDQTKNPTLNRGHLSIRISLAILALFLGGCSVWGPDYQSPQTDAPKRWRSTDAYARMGGGKIPAMAWWNKFRDPPC